MAEAAADVAEEGPAKFTRSGVRPPSFIRLPASMKRGIARKRKTGHPSEGGLDEGGDRDGAADEGSK